MAFATALTIGGSIAQAGSSLYGGLAESASAEYQKRLSRYNASVERMTARAIEAKTKFDQMRSAMMGRRRIGTLRARAGASGALVSEGAPAMAIAEQAGENALETALIGVAGRTEAGQHYSQANLDLAQGRIYGQRSRNYATAGLIGAGSSLLSGFGTMYDEGMWPFGGKKTSSS